MRTSARIPAEFRGGFREASGKRLPKAISCTCPYCSEKGVFVLSTVFPPTLRSTWSTSGTCPSCGESPEFFIIFERIENDKYKEPFEVVMYPPAVNEVEPITLPGDFPKSVREAISDAEESFRVGLYSPALTCGGRALEGIFYHLAGADEKRKKLFDLVESVCNQEAAYKPLKDLAHAIRQGRNVGAHFDENIQPDKESALLVIELL